MATPGLKSTDLYRNHQIYAQRTAEVTFPLTRMFNFFKTVLNDPPDEYIAIDTFVGIKLITEENQWIHLHLGAEDDTLQIEVFDPNESVDKQGELIDFARNLAGTYLSE